MGDWSTAITLSKYSMPSISSCAAGSSCGRYKVRETAAYSVSLTSVDLPDPDTPVTQVNRPTGNDAVTLFRLLPLAPMTRISCTWLASAGGGAGSHGVRRRGTAMAFL